MIVDASSFQFLVIIIVVGFIIVQFIAVGEFISGICSSWMLAGGRACHRCCSSCTSSVAVGGEIGRGVSELAAHGNNGE